MPSAPDRRIRPTRAEIHLDALAHNLGVVRSAAPGAEVHGVVKADAYGHGLVPVARRLVAEGIDGLCVALVEEGLALRAAGIDAPVLVLNGLYDGAHAEVIEARLTPVVYDLADVDAFVAAGSGVGVHLKIDTGMTRLGVRPEDLDGFLDGLDPNVRLEGLMTHLSASEDDGVFTAAQLAVFDDAVRRVRARGHDPVCHAANSGGILLRPEAHADRVRAGVALYGVRPTPDSTLDLRGVMRLVASVARVVEVPAGTPVGYGRTFVTKRPSRIATLAIGYGDGLTRHLSNRGVVLVDGQRCPIVGRVSMDLTGVDVTGVRCERGDEAVLFGQQGEARLRVEEVAAAAGTIGYEVLTAVSPRVPRVVVEG